MLQRMPMGPNGVGMGDYGMLRFPSGMPNENLQRRALQNRGGLGAYVSSCEHSIHHPQLPLCTPRVRCLILANNNTR